MQQRTERPSHSSRLPGMLSTCGPQLGAPAMKLCPRKLCILPSTSHGSSDNHDCACHFSVKRNTRSSLYSQLKPPKFYFALMPLVVTEYRHHCLTSHPNEPNSCSRKIKAQTSKVLRTTDKSLEKTGTVEPRINEAPL